MRLRFGFDPCLNADYHNHPKFVEGEDLMRLRRDFQDTVSECPTNDRQFERHLQNFACFLKDHADVKKTAENPPSCLWDLSPDHPRYLGNRSTSLVIFYSACLVNGDAFNPKSARTLYSLSVEGTQPAWTLFVEDSSIALECLRGEFKSTNDIARTLLLRGTPFYTGAKSLEIPRQDPNDYEFQLGGFGTLARDEDYELDHADLSAYQTNYLQFVQSPTLLQLANAISNHSKPPDVADQRARTSKFEEDCGSQIAVTQGFITR